ncbi:amino acid ABC transporter permease [Pseudoroseicyclus aestuarii]|uniref:Amino acid ABC transporter membrane protein 2 (PAAT family) n=1 Tax=Pseudoroseicyclus aestuarii TaxID=1795041 RepID=A0A318T3Y6_9RHOB|nr:amino acid ABC transporter permease [Pseudoroseicyclus aestuarii]PYE81208.1 amino acid ABC transporter membrane protein 2 (PAAT family) [Pseudoroseicyclus aestuarii]
MIHISDPETPRLPPRTPHRPLLKLFFGDVLSAALTALALVAVFMLLPGLNWVTLDANWAVADPDLCRQGGACWAFIRAKLNLILFGLYPPSEQWRAGLVIVIILAMILVSLWPRVWGGRLLLVWAGAVAAMLILMRGGMLGLAPVPTSKWGGLPVTLMLATLSLGLAFPLAVLLALGRRGRLPIARAVCVTLIELVRGLPLVGLLFVAAILLPLLLPPDWTVDKLGRTLAALTIFAAAYLAEVIRGGLQGLDTGQTEAAEALGIPYWKTIWHIVLPQAIQNVIPPLTNTAIVMVKNTSLVLIVGVFDMLSAARSAATDPAWPAPYAESYLFVALIYFAICFGISAYSAHLERGVRARRHS